MTDSCPDLKTAYAEGEDDHQIYGLQRENAVFLLYISAVQLIMNTHCHSGIQNRSKQYLQNGDLVCIVTDSRFALSPCIALHPL